MTDRRRSNASQVPSAEEGQRNPREIEAKETEDSGCDSASGDEEPSPEEQMARFEEQLKNEDWGHQPC